MAQKGHATAREPSKPETAITRPERHSMFEDVETFANQIGDVFDRAFANFMLRRGRPLAQLRETLMPELAKVEWSPRVEILERDGKLIVRAELPGIPKENVKVEAFDDHIAITGERKSETEEKKEGFYRSERLYGSFYRSIPLPVGAIAENATATMTDGVLEITLTMTPREEPKGKPIEVKTPKA
jgi:HSP20 family protein